MNEKKEYIMKNEFVWICETCSELVTEGEVIAYTEQAVEDDPMHCRPVNDQGVCPRCDQITEFYSPENKTDDELSEEIVRTGNMMVTLLRKAATSREQWNKVQLDAFQDAEKSALDDYNALHKTMMRLIEIQESRLEVREAA